LSLTITIGWWIVPAIITLAPVIYMMLPTRYSYYGADFAGAIIWMALVILSLIAWLIWALAS
jgi:hypothetical protein